MKIKLSIFIVITTAFTFCRNATPDMDSNEDCKRLNNQAMDSLSLYKTTFNKRKSTLEFSLRLLNEAIKCDSDLNVARINKVTVLNELGQFHQAISLLNELILLKKDSSLLLIKAPIYNRINEPDSLTLTYRLAYKYFSNKLKDDPQNVDLIFGKIFSKSKVYGKESVRSEIDAYMKKYPNDVNLKMLLAEIIR
jgi:tetratricopeptide (TPR) repeat protein